MLKIDNNNEYIFPESLKPEIIISINFIND